MTQFALFFYVMVIALPAAAWRAYAAIILWGWFVTPTFSLDAPSLWVMAGLMTLVSLLVSAKADKEQDEPLAAAINFTIKTALLPAFVIAFGWIFKTLAA